MRKSDSYHYIERFEHPYFDKIYFIDIVHLPHGLCEAWLIRPYSQHSVLIYEGDEESLDNEPEFNYYSFICENIDDIIRHYEEIDFFDFK